MAPALDYSVAGGDLSQGQLRASQSYFAINLIAAYARFDWAGGLFDCFNITVGSRTGRRVPTTSLRSCRPNP